MMKVLRCNLCIADVLFSIFVTHQNGRDVNSVMTCVKR